MREPQRVTLRQRQAAHLNRGSGRPLGIIPGFDGRGAAHGCLWVEGDDCVKKVRSRVSPFCEAVRREGSVYCEAHHRRCYRRPGEVE